MISFCELPEDCLRIAETKRCYESVLKRQKRSEGWDLAKKPELEAAKKKNHECGKLIFIRARQYAKGFEEQQQKELVRLKREAKLKGGFHVNSEAKLLFMLSVQGKIEWI